MKDTRVAHDGVERTLNMRFVSRHEVDDEGIAVIRAAVDRRRARKAAGAK